jgi:hypothetical protein
LWLDQLSLQPCQTDPPVVLGPRFRGDDAS